MLSRWQIRPDLPPGKKASAAGKKSGSAAGKKSMLREDSRTGQGGLTPASYQLRASEQAGNGLPRASLHAYTIEEEKRAIPFCLREADRGLACQTEFAASVFVLETKAPIPGCDVSEVGIRGERQWTWLRRCISWSVLQALTSWPRASSCPSLSSQQEDSPACTDMSGCMYWELVQCDSHALAAQQGRAIRGALGRLCTAAADRRPRRCARPRKVVLVLPGPLAMARGMGLCDRWHAGGSRVRCRGFGGGNVCGSEIVARVRPGSGISNQVARAHAPEHAAPGAVSQAEPSLPRRCSST